MFLGNIVNFKLIFHIKKCKRYRQIKRIEYFFDIIKMYSFFFYIIYNSRYHEKKNEKITFMKKEKIKLWKITFYKIKTKPTLNFLNHFQSYELSYLLHFILNSRNSKSRNIPYKNIFRQNELSNKSVSSITNQTNRTVHKRIRNSSCQTRGQLSPG